jgi:putative serine protease PepD
MRGPRHLWTGEWRDEAERARAEADARAAAAYRERAERDAAAARVAAAASPGSGMRRRALALVLAGVTALAAISAGAFSAGALLSSDKAAEPAAALPVVSAQAVKPRSGQTRAGAIYAKASPAVVSVRTSEGSGTGFLIDRDGTIVTNAHVVGSADRVIVRFGADGDSLDAEVRGVDTSSDLAVLTIERASVPKGVTPLTFADSRQVAIGDTAIAIGNPLGLDRTATEGIVSGLGRSITAPSGFDIPDAIQTDAPINPGNSGGPLLDDSGRVIGVNSQIATAGGGSQGNIGIGFAVPSNTVRQVVPQLERGERIARPYLGLQSSAATGSVTDGAKVESVVAGGPADRAGLRAGDVIIRVGKQAVSTPEDVAKAIVAQRPGDKIDIEIRRNGATETIKATLGDRPTNAPAATTP